MNRLAGLFAWLPASTAVDVLTTLRASRQEIQGVGLLVDRWHTVGPQIERELQSASTPSEAAVRRWVAALGRLNIGQFVRLASAIWAARRAAGQPAPQKERVNGLYRRMSRSAFADTIDLGGLRVDGDDLRRAGIPAGPGLGKILQALLAAVIDDPSRNDVDWLLTEAKRRHELSV